MAATFSPPLAELVINIGLFLAGIDLDLFDATHEAAVVSALIAALAAAANVQAASVAVRRVRDVSDPAAPVLLFANPLFSSDTYARRLRLEARRLLVGSVAVDLQIVVASSAAAASLGASLAAGPLSLAADIAASLSNQGSPLAATTQLTATVQSYPNFSVGAAPVNAAPPPLSGAVAAGAVVATCVVVAFAVMLGRMLLRRSQAVAAASEAEADPGVLVDTKPRLTLGPTSMLGSTTSPGAGEEDEGYTGLGAARRAVDMSASALASLLPSAPRDDGEALAINASTGLQMRALPGGEALAHALSSAAGGIAGALSAAAPSIPLIGLAMSALSALLAQLQNMGIAAVAASALAARLVRLRTLIQRAASLGEGEGGEGGGDEGGPGSAFSNEHPGIFQSLVETLRRADRALRAIAERSRLGAFIGSSGDTDLLAAIDRAISLHVAELSAALAAETMASVRSLHQTIRSTQSATKLPQVPQQQLLAAAPPLPAATEEPTQAPAAALPPFSVSLKLADLAFEPPLEQQLQTAERGASGVVVLATWRTHSLPVAVKVMNARMATGEAAIPITAWLAEAELMRRLREHKPRFVVTLFGISATLDTLGNCDRYLVVMERLGGGSLRALLDGYLARGRRPPLAQALQWLLDTARGLSECHEAGVVHSDVKAANVLLDGARRAKLGDLGSGRVTRGLSASASALAITTTEAGAGRSSVLWLASELVDDPKQLPSTFSDVFAWAVMAWEVLSCRLPFHGADGVLTVDILRPRVMMDLVSGVLRPDMAAVRPDAPHAVVALVQRCWAADPQERPAIAEVARSLEAAVRVLERSRAAAAEREVLVAAALDAESDVLRAAEAAAAEEDARAAAEDLAVLRASLVDVRAARLTAIQRRREEAERSLRADAASAAAALEAEGAAWLAAESARAEEALTARRAALLNEVGLARAKRLREGGAGLGEADRLRIVAEFEAEQRLVELRLDEERERQAAALRERLAERRAARARAAEERALERQRELDEHARRETEAERARGDEEVLRADLDVGEGVLLASHSE